MLASALSAHVSVFATIETEICALRTIKFSCVFPAVHQRENAKSGEVRLRAKSFLLPNIAYDLRGKLAVNFGGYVKVCTSYFPDAAPVTCVA